MTILMCIPTFYLVFGLSTKGIYGLTAVYELALRYDGGPVQIKEIADAHGIPQHYLEQLLVSLRRSGITASFRGVQGGYRLADSPAVITVRKVLEALEGPLAVVSDDRQGGVLRFFFSEIESVISRVLDLTLAELIEKKHKGAPMYFI